MTMRDSAFLRAQRALLSLLASVLLATCSDTTAPNNPVPVLSAADPANVIAGSTGTIVTLTGQGFVGSSRVRWNGSDRPTTFVSATSLKVQLNTQDFAGSGLGALTVYNPPPGGGTSGSLSFTINPAVPPPHIDQLLPGKAYIGTALTLFVAGSNFTPTSVVRWNGSDRPTTALDETAVLAQISAADLAVAGTASVTVFNSEPGSGSSPAVALPIVPVPAATHPAADFYIAYTISGRPHGVSVAPSGRFYVSLIDGNAVRRGTVDPNGQSFSSPVAVGTQPAHVAIDLQGQRAYTANQGGQSVSVLDAEANTLSTTLPLTEQGFNVLVSPSEKRVYVSTEAGHLLVFDTQTLQQVASIPVGHAANGIAVDTTNRRLYVSSIADATISAIDLSNNTVVRTYVVSGRPQRIALSPDRTELYIASEAAGLEILDLAAGTRTSVAGVNAGAVGLALSPDGEQIYVTNPPSGLVQIVTRATRQVFRTFNNMGSPRNVAFEAHGTVAIVTAEQGYVIFIR